MTLNSVPGVCTSDKSVTCHHSLHQGQRMFTFSVANAYKWWSKSNTLHTNCGKLHIMLQQKFRFCILYNTCIMWQQGLSLSQAYSYPPLLLIYTFCIPSDNENFFLSFKESNNSYPYNCNISIKAGYAMPQIINYKQKREGKMYIHLSKNCTYILPIKTLLTIDFCINNAQHIIPNVKKKQL